MPKLDKNEDIEKVTHYEGGITVWRQTTNNYIERSKKILEGDKINQELINSKNLIKNLNIALSKKNQDNKIIVDSLNNQTNIQNQLIEKKNKKIKNKNRVIYALGIISIPTLIQLGQLISNMIK